LGQRLELLCEKPDDGEVQEIAAEPGVAFRLERAFRAAPAYCGIA
jgi:hypothetical protein